MFLSLASVGRGLGVMSISCQLSDLAGKPSIEKHPELGSAPLSLLIAPRSLINEWVD